MGEYAALGWFAALCAATLGLGLGVGRVLAGRRPAGGATAEPVPGVEPGVETSPPPLGQAGFYPLALVCALSQPLVVLLFPWAAAARELGWTGLGAAAALLLALIAALAYARLKGALEWE
jgi:NADH:ubiquinone oxidoreductase subunit 3 (subunit A)